MTLNEKKNFLPDFCALKMLLAVFFLTQLLALLLTLAANSTELGFFSEFALRSLFSLWIALSGTVVLCGLKNRLQNLENGVVGLLAFLIIQIVAILMGWLVITVLPQWQILILIPAPEKIAFYARTLGITSLVSMAFLRYLYVLFQWQQQVEAKAVAKLNALQARMRPHFLFNSLNSIASLTRINPPLAETLIEDLAELIRASMTIDENLLIRLEQEVDLVKLYLAIEIQRLDERLNVIWQWDDVPKDALIPPLSLQPLVENAVYYGIEPNLQGGKILITGHLHFNRLFIQVTNPQVLINTHSRQGNQIALKNLTARLKGCFDDDAMLRVEHNDKTYQITLEIPYRK
jgi:two-component system sensor histidine kinase AlgZ